MEAYLDRLLQKLEKKNELGGYWSISRQTGEYLYSLIISRKPKRIVEIGGGNGYSTIWLALGAQEVGGLVTSFEFVPEKVAEWVSHLQKARLIRYAQIIPDDANKRLMELPDGIDLLFLDGRKNEYLDQIKTLLPKMSRTGVVVADNISSHPDVLKTFLEYVRNSDTLKSEFVDVGTGLEVVTLKSVMVIPRLRSVLRLSPQ